MTFQRRVLDWMMACFSMEVCRDRQERNHRFLEESLELVQSLGCTSSEAHQLVDYVFGRDLGEPEQELGGVMVTLAALCFPNDLNMEAAAEKELARVWTKIDKIRAKQAAKPQHSPLPERNGCVIRAGDTVHHEPTGEDWVVAYVDGDYLAWCGWPAGEAKISDCWLKKSCTDEEHVKWLHDIAKADGKRGRRARLALEDLPTLRGTS
jgi:hypothetical protein